MTEKKSKELLLLIDSHAIIHRAFHAFPITMATSKGEVVNSVYGFATILLEVINKFKPDYVICAIDTPGVTQRHDMFNLYKATRKEPDNLLINQIPRIREVIETFNIPIFGVPGFEADDIIGTIVTNKDCSKLDKLIVTGDQDIFQLVEDNTKVFMSGFKFSQSKIYDAEGVKEKMSFGPEFVVDYKALRGDSSDNIPGVKGIGEKTAKELIAEFGHLDDIYKNIDKIKSKSVREKLINDAEMAEMSRQLATIIKDVPITLDLKHAKFGDFDPNKIFELFRELEFKSLLAKIPGGEKVTQIGTNDNNQKTVKQTKTNYIVLKNNKVDEFITDLSKQKVFAYDTETTGLGIMTAEVVGMSFSWQKGHAYYLDTNLLNEKQIGKLKEVFADPEIKKVAHNLKFDMHTLSNQTLNGLDLNFEVNGIEHDTMLGAYVLNGGGGAVGLKTLAFNELGMVMRELEEVVGKPKRGEADSMKQLMLDSNLEELGNYACADADATWQLYELQKEKFQVIDNEKLKVLFYDIEMPLIKLLWKLEREGIEIDEAYLDQFGQKVDSMIASVTEEIYKSVGHEFNISSPKQVGEVLFGELGLPGGRKTKTGAWQTHERALMDYATAHPMVELLLKYRELTKIQSTYVVALSNAINQNTGKIHTSFNQTIASTGRLSSVNPNLQNIPIVGDIGKQIRTAFIAGKKQKLVSFDLSQQELRILAHMSDEEELVKAYKNDVDVHALTASRIFKVGLDKVTKEQRAKGKTLNFSLIYGISAFGLADRMKIPFEEANQLIKSYFEVYPKVKTYFDKLLEESKQIGRVSTMFGRWRDASGLRSPNMGIRNATTREVINFPIQGTAADMVKIMMQQCDEFITKDSKLKDLNPRMILQVHDELIFVVNDSKDLDYFCENIKRIMSNAVKLKVPVEVGMSVGDNWGELK